MTMNPYQPPRDFMGAPPPPAFPSGPMAFTLSDVMSAAWRAFTDNAAALVLAPVVAGLLMMGVFVLGLGGVILVVGLPQGLERLPALPPEAWNPVLNRIVAGPAVYAGVLAWTIVQTALDAFFRGGLAQMRVAAARGTEVRFGDLFRGAHFGSMIGLRFLVGAPHLLVLVLGLLARVFKLDPLIAACRWLDNLVTLFTLGALLFGMALADYFVADAGQGPLGALRSAFAAPAPDRGGVFGVLFVAGLIAFAGLCCCGFGGLVSIPFAYLCGAVLYTRLTGTLGREPQPQ